METLDFEEETGKQIRRYLDLIRRRSNGTRNNRPLKLDADDTLPGSLMTLASWMRNFVRAHPDYKRDSVVSQEINYALLVAVDEM